MELCMCLENVLGVPWALKFFRPILSSTIPLLGYTHQEYCQMDQSVTRVML